MEKQRERVNHNSEDYNRFQQCPVTTGGRFS